ncbi:50S ribosome-binding GTPase, partial [Oryctes borbonicus]
MSEKVVNVLLLGETGVGKSTFINILGNFLTYNTLDEAAAGNILYSVPTKFSMIDEDLAEHEIIVGSSNNEVTVAGASSTQNPKTYLFNLKNNNAKLRVIDTPGIGDTRGMQYDEWNTEKLLTFISELDYLNAICIMLKPNNSRFSVLFDYCMKQILLRLDKKVKSNIVFVFTNARSSFYTPGDTFVPLQHMLRQIETGPLQTKIPFNSSNIFCVDNESFRYLAARSSGLQFSEEVTQEYRTSWNKSFATAKKMLQYCANLP